MNYAMPQVSKTDLEKTILYLEGAIKQSEGSRNSAIVNRARLIKLHIKKLKSKLS